MSPHVQYSIPLMTTSCMNSETATAFNLTAKSNTVFYWLRGTKDATSKLIYPQFWTPFCGLPIYLPLGYLSAFRLLISSLHP